MVESDVAPLGSRTASHCIILGRAILARGVSGCAHEAAQILPVVFVYVADPIGFGFAASFAHPGGNMTGFTFVESTMGSKWLEQLKEIAPRTGRVALLFNPATAPQSKFFIPSIQAAALSHAVEVSVTPVHAADEIEGVIVAQAAQPRWQPHRDARRIHRYKSSTYHCADGAIRSPRHLFPSRFCGIRRPHLWC